MLDQIFGERNFINEIICKRQLRGRDERKAKGKNFGFYGFSLVPGSVS
jgi:adenine specific DNA methylase Mod